MASTGVLRSAARGLRSRFCTGVGEWEPSLSARCPGSEPGRSFGTTQRLPPASVASWASEELGHLLAACDPSPTPACPPCAESGLVGGGCSGACAKALRSELRAVADELRLSILAELRRELASTASWRAELRNELSIGLRLLADAARDLRAPARQADGGDAAPSGLVDSRLTDLQEVVRQLREDIRTLPVRADAPNAGCSGASAPAVLRELREVQARRNVAVDLSSGVVTVCRPIEFVQSAEAVGGQVRVELDRTETTDHIFRDIRELWAILRVKIRIEGRSQRMPSSQGFTPEQRVRLRGLALQRAECVRERLLEEGVAASDLLTSGEVGVGNKCVIIKLDMFPNS